MKMKEKIRKRLSLSLAELAEKAGISTRTVRFYIQQKLISRPTGIGRGSHYTTLHLQQAQRVVKLQRSGMTLNAIRRAPKNRKMAMLRHLPPAPPELLVRAPIMRGIYLEVDANIGLPTPTVMNRIGRVCRRILLGKRVKRAK